MKNRNLGILIAILGVLIVIYIIQQLSTTEKTVSESMITIYPDFNSSNVNSIRVFKLTYPDSGLGFTKKDGRWMIPSYFGAPAREKDIDKLFNDIKSLEGEIRSTRKDLFTDYEIEDSVALHIAMQGPDSSTILHMLVGKGVPQAARSSFIRNAGSDTVYKADKNFLSRFSAWDAPAFKRLPGRRWADLALTKIDKSKLASFTIKTPRHLYSFRKKEIPPKDSTAEPTYTWEQVKPSKGKKLDEKDIKSLAGHLARLNSNDIIDNRIKREYGLEKPKYSARLTTDADSTIVIDFGAKIDTTSNARYALVEGQPFVYKVAKYNFESIFKRPFAKKK